MAELALLAKTVADLQTQIQTLSFSDVEVFARHRPAATTAGGCTRRSGSSACPLCTVSVQAEASQARSLFRH